jgi:alpha-tubulin suppressor-like RCC1 family protein
MSGTRTISMIRCWRLGVLALLLSSCGDVDPYRQKTPLEQHIYLDPTAVTAPVSFDRVGMGFGVSCMLTAAGQAWCWGRNEHGELGAATTERCAGGNIPCSWQPLAAAGSLRLASISPAGRYSCGLDAAGAAWCWGFGAGGQLGDGRRLDSATPVAVAGGHRFVQLDAGHDSGPACGLDAAGVAWCWGPYALPAGSGTVAATPVAVTAAPRFVAIGAGAEYACGLDASGQAWCWGRNAEGQLGRGSEDASDTPVAVSTGERFASLAVGGWFSCGLTSAGAAWCWGFGLSVGDGTANTRLAPVAVAGGHVFTRLSAGYQHACGLKADGIAWCWGPAALVGSGANDPFNMLSPVAVSGGHRFRTLQAGGVATCAITVDGSPLCWGINSYGAVGQDNVDR